jgi:hypothetical protein
VQSITLKNQNYDGLMAEIFVAALRGRLPQHGECQHPKIQGTGFTAADRTPPAAP